MENYGFIQIMKLSCLRRNMGRHIRKIDRNEGQRVSPIFIYHIATIAAYFCQFLSSNQ